MNIQTRNINVDNSVPSTIEHNIPLANKNWFGTGGAARFFCRPMTITQWQSALAWAHSNALEVFVLGSGANILINDDGFDGLVIQPALTAITLQPENDKNSMLVTADAGVLMHDLIAYCLENNLGGLEEFSGIPSTVGGATYINLHYFEFLLEHFLVDAHVMHALTGNITKVETSWFDFGYNHSKLIHGDYYLVNATFKLKKLTDYETAFALGRRHEMIRYRKKRYPTQGTCGSFFRNFYPSEIQAQIEKTPLIFIAYYLDKIGVKGSLRVGNAQVSHQHSNMLINLGGATSNDIIQLARIMQELVYENFQVTAQPECQLIGFKNNPLHQNLAA